MRPNDENVSVSLKENLVDGGRGRGLAKLVGAVVAVLAGLALLCRSLWDLRDEWPSWTVPAAVSQSASVRTSDDQSLALGQRVYQARCSRCHGQDGHGDGPDVAKSQVRLRDIASASRHSGADRDAVRRVILEGTPDKSMPGSPENSTAQELDSVVDYVFFLEISDHMRRAGLTPVMGESAPPLLFRGAEGTVGSLDQLRGKVVLVAFWGTTCEPCIAELPDLESLADRYQKTDFVVLPICVDETNAQTTREVAARHAPNLPVYVDLNGSVGKDFNVRHLPQSVLVDREGRMLGRAFGALRWTGKEFEQLLSAGLGLASPLPAAADPAL